MSTSAKKCQPKNSKKSKCKYASPMSNDRAEAFVGPQAGFLPLFSEVPSERDKRAFELAAQGMTQREIAKKLKTSQPTVQRAIKKYRLWFGSTLPEDREKLVGWGRFRVAVEERRIFLRHLQEPALEEWHQSRQSVPMKRKRTRLDPQGQKLDGMPIKDIQIDEWVQHRRANASHLNAAAKRSLELTMLEGGYLGVEKLTCDQVIDTDERDRWDLAVKSRDKTIEELTRKVADLEALVAADRGRVHAAERNARASDEAAGVNPPQGNANPACISQSLMHPTPNSLDESRTAQITPAVNHDSPGSVAATPVEKATSADASDSCRSVLQSMNQVNRTPAGVPALAGLADPAKPPEGGTPTCLSDDDVALRLMQIRRLNARR